MPYCPDCGRHIALGDIECPECGSRIGADTPEGPTGTPEQAQQPRRSGQDPATRRRALGYASGVLGLLVVCAVGLEAVEGTDPIDVVDEWRAAWTGGDETAYGELWHPEATADPEAWWADELGSEPDESVRYTSESREVVEETPTTAAVRETFFLGHPSLDDRLQLTDVIDLRTVEDEWRIYGVRTEAVDPVSDCNRRLTVTGGGSLDCE